MKTIKDATNFDELLDIKYGKPGTEKRDEFEVKAKAFIVGEMVKEKNKVVVMQPVIKKYEHSKGN